VDQQTPSYSFTKQAAASPRGAHSATGRAIEGQSPARGREWSGRRGVATDAARGPAAPQSGTSGLMRDRRGAWVDGLSGVWNSGRR
jgi:hypothetical protein